jgi:hypothetical protein
MWLYRSSIAPDRRPTIAIIVESDAPLSANLVMTVCLRSRIRQLTLALARGLPHAVLNDPVGSVGSLPWAGLSKALGKPLGMVFGDN